MRKATIDDVARESGVAKSTVSRVINNTPGARVSPVTRARIVAAAQRLNYIADASARSLRSRQSRVIGLIAQTWDQYSDAVFAKDFLAGLAAGVASRQLHLVVAVSISPEDEMYHITNGIQSGRFDGFIISGCWVEDQRVRTLAEAGFPVVTIGRSECPSVPYIDSDNVRVSSMSVEYLLGLGHKRIALIEAPLNYIYARDRLLGYRLALESAGIPFDERLVRHGVTSWLDACSATGELLSMDERPTAIVTVDDFVAMSVLREAAAAGIDVPGELSVIGCNNASLAEQVYPPLTSIDIHMYEIGFQAAELFDRLVYNSAPVANIIVRHDLIVRKSTAPCCARENERARVKK